VEPYAYTPEEFQELTNYARSFYIDLIPYIDAPAHISFILKHPEYADLRAFANSNYGLSVTNPRAEEVLLKMIDNLIEANKGGKYFFLSTDEAYYTGMAESEKKQAEDSGGNGRLLAAYIKRIADKVRERGRKVIIWGEYPLRPSDVSALPSHLINGINDNSEIFGTTFRDQGIRHLVFTSAQGVEPLFPEYHKLPKKKLQIENNSLALTDDELQQGDIINGRVGEIVQTTGSSIKAGKSDLMGIIVCGWADAGLNPETFWLGYAAGTAAAWNTKDLNAEDLTNRFYQSFYGRDAVDIGRLYQLLSAQAQFWAESWDWQSSAHRTPILGYSAAIFDTPKPAKDQTLPQLPLPSPDDLAIGADWIDMNKHRLQSAEKFMKENEELMKLLDQNISITDSRQYNLQVLYSVAILCRQNLTMLLDLNRINELLTLSSRAVKFDPALAIGLVDQAFDQAKRIRNDRNQVLQEATMIWYQDWFPRIAEANGRQFLDQVDDIKDHPPVRTVDMSYLIYRQLKYPLGKWSEQLLNTRNQYARKNNLPVRNETLDWEKY